MSSFLGFITAHWFAVLLLLTAFVPAALALRRRSFRQLPPAAGLALAGLGGMILAPDWGLWIVAAALSTFLVMFLVLVFSSAWLRPLAYLVAAILAFGLGLAIAVPLGQAFVEIGKDATSVEIIRPWWLLLLLFIPILFWLSYRSLAGLGSVRRWIALALRGLLIALIAFALADVRLKHRNDTVTVLFVVDRSLSVPQEPSPNDPNTDLRWQRVKKFINDAVEKRGSGHERDRAGLIVFGRRPRLELPPSDAPRFKFQELASTIDGNYTDIAAALKLALASFPEGSGKRIVLLSDGNRTSATPRPRPASPNATACKSTLSRSPPASADENEVLVERVTAPRSPNSGQRLVISVLLRNHNPNPVSGELTLRRIVEGVPHRSSRRGLSPCRPV